MNKIQFTQAQHLQNFFANVEALCTRQDCPTKVDRASKILATYTINEFLDKHRKLRSLAYLEKKVSITIDNKTALAVFILSNGKSEYFTNLIGTTDQHLLLN